MFDRNSQMYLEGILLPEATEAFPPTVNQFGFTKNTSTVDAAFIFDAKVQQLKDEGTFEAYSINK